MAFGPIRLPRMQQGGSLIDTAGRPATWFVRMINDALSQIEQAFNGIQAAIDNAATAQAAADGAQDTAIAAATGAAAAALAAASAAAAAGSAQTTANNAVVKDAGPAWTDATGTAARTALASYAGQVVSNPPTQAQVQQVDDALKALSQHVVAIINDLKANGALT